MHHVKQTMRTLHFIPTQEMAKDKPLALIPGFTWGTLILITLILITLILITAALDGGGNLQQYA